MDEITIFTDGACQDNPKGPGGYGAIIMTVIKGKPFQKELSKGFSNTTNNRMELMAVAAALEALKKPCKARIYSDSKYVVNAIKEKWVFNWKRYGWFKSAKSKERPKNIDLWKRTLAAMEGHEIEIFWVKGHAGIPENERCDQLAMEASRGKNLETDQNETEPTDNLLF